MQQKTQYLIEFKNLETEIQGIVHHPKNSKMPMVFAIKSRATSYINILKKTNGEKVQFRPIVETICRREGEWK